MAQAPGQDPRPAPAAKHPPGNRRRFKPRAPACRGGCREPPRDYISRQAPPPRHPGDCRPSDAGPAGRCSPEAPAALRLPGAEVVARLGVGGGAGAAPATVGVKASTGGSNRAHGDRGGTQARPPATPLRFPGPTHGSNAALGRGGSGERRRKAPPGPRHCAHCTLGSHPGISRDNWHKRRKTGGKRKPYHKKRKYELGRPPANTKIGPRRIHTVRVRGGNKKYRALRLDVGNFSWGSECCTRKTRIIDVVYNASNNELVRTKTLVKNCIVLIDSTPYRQWYEAHYALPLGRKKGAKLTPEEEEILNKKRSKKIQKKYDERKKHAKIANILEEQFQQGKLLACIASRPGQCGRADGYVLEGKELEFYLRKIKARKGK
ncbi:40S ribosomal protein S8 [Corapipo altera]|nr:40S ribosomal protein S8 [Corapipo altera]